MSAWAAFRADADAETGAGHLMRCLTLAWAWQAAGNRAVLLTATANRRLLQRVTDTGVEIVELGDHFVLGPAVEWAGTRHGCWVILDGYGFDEDCHLRLKDAGARVLVIDDWVRLPRYHCDVLLDQNFGAEGRDYLVDEGCAVLLGPRFALVAPEFAARAAESEPVTGARTRLLVTMGGADPQNQTAKALDALSGVDEDELEVTVAIGAANRHAAEIRRRVDSIPGCRLEEDARDMPELMARADVAVSASGTTCWELACMGVPSVLVVLAENQRPAAEALDAAGVFVNAGWHEDVSPDDISRALHSLLRHPGTRAKMRERAQRLVDGRGAGRVVAAMMEQTG